MAEDPFPSTASLPTELCGTVCVGTGCAVDPSTASLPTELCGTVCVGTGCAVEYTLAVVCVVTVLPPVEESLETEVATLLEVV